MPLPSWTEQAVTQPQAAAEPDITQLVQDEYVDPSNPRWGLRSEWRYTVVTIGDKATTVYQRVTECSMPALPLMTFTPWGNPLAGGLCGPIPKKSDQSDA